ncbi:hypothetical protein A9Q84_19790 [Halobacteriovorax marinus]|uniref:Lipoprotein n=1 Tax=Halobacteriovorax marinus TaxID=97084 RepID=A0A1Y5F850_9BACT|nr:hypothetical protein A9Q84_19790 [Halobacteriovorax marinus]
MKTLFKFIILLSLSSCAYFKQLGTGPTFSSTPDSPNTARINKEFQLSDKAGKFYVHREKGFSKSKNQFIVKKTVKAGDNGKILEKLIMISKLGNLNKKLTILRPTVSEYSVWFDGKKYTTRMKINSKKRSMDVTLNSPERQWQGKRSYSFPNGDGIFCYFSQITECARATGFIEKSIKNDGGSMKVIIIWEGYPYFQEQYLNVPSSVFSRARFSYDGKNAKGERRFTLTVANQSIFYFLDKNHELSKKFWVSQGLSMVEKK